MNLKETADLLMAIRKPRKERARGRSPMMRRNVIRRASGACEVCVFPVLDVLNVHHIVPIHKGGESEILNLVLLCPNCHTLAHLCSRILSKGVDAAALAPVMIENGVREPHVHKLILIGTERAMVTYSGEIVERPRDATSLKELILRDMKPAPQPSIAGDT